MRFVFALMLAGISGLATKSSLALADNSVCNIQFSQSVSVSGNALTARFTPASGSVAPTFVDLHISKNCPGNPSVSSGVCPTPFFQPPFDQPYAFNIHSSSDSAAYSSAGTSFDGHSFNFVLDITKLALSSSDQLCYDFTYAFGTTGCDTGICTLAPPTTAPFILPTTCDALTYTQDVAINGNRILAHFIPDAGKPIPTWVDLHVSKNCPGNPAKSNSSCSTPFFQQPFDQPYALNLHAASDSTQFSTPGASYSNGVFTWDFDASVLTSVLGGNDVFCYDFTWGFGNLGCNGGVCSLVSPSTSPIIVPPSQQPSCAAASYTQSVSISGNTVLAVFTPTPGSRIPTFVDFHISKNCPNSPSTSTGQCSSPWVQSPFDQPYSFNLHDSAIGTYSSSGATYNPVNNAFTFIFDASKLTSTLSATDKLCYDFTFVFGEFGCDTGICAVSSGTA